MKIVQINSTCGYGSIGKICQAISELLTNQCIENYILYSRSTNGYDKAIKYSKYATAKISSLKSRIYGNYGFNSKSDTIALIKKLEEINPNIVHIHNIHSHDCHLGYLFSYLREKQVKVYFTFHDCWAFTGYCPYFDVVGCKKWQRECYECPLWHRYSWFIDRSNVNFLKKKDAFRDLNLTIITPSKWLANLVKQSFFGQYGYSVKVINNGINLNIFRPRKSELRAKWNLGDKKVILGVSLGWETRKGIETFIRLSKELSSNFQIILVGTNKRIDKTLPANIFSIHKTNNQEELAEIYSMADVFVNPTMEENFPTTNIEALACGTPVITYDTGGSGEMVNGQCGLVIPKGEYNLLVEAIRKMPSFKSEDCLKQAQHYNQEDKYYQYYQEYMSAINKIDIVQNKKRDK